VLARVGVSVDGCGRYDERNIVYFCKRRIAVNQHGGIGLIGGDGGGFVPFWLVWTGFWSATVKHVPSMPMWGVIHHTSDQR